MFTSEHAMRGYNEGTKTVSAGDIARSKWAWSKTISRPLNAGARRERKCNDAHPSGSERCARVYCPARQTSSSETGRNCGVQDEGVEEETPVSNISVDPKYKPFLDAWDMSFVDTDEDPDGYYVDVVEGSIPEEITGTFFRNGPNRFVLDRDNPTSAAVQHPYDGDGFLASLSIKNGKAFFRSRFVKTVEFEAEYEAKKVLFRGTFATQRQGGTRRNVGDLYVKNTANTNVVCYNSNLWALFEAGQPYKIDPYTLQTLGLDTMDGNVSVGLPFDLGSENANNTMALMVRRAQMFGEEYFSNNPLQDELTMPGGDAVTAHPHHDPATNRLVTFSYKIRPGFLSSQTVLDQLARGAPLFTEIRFMEFNSDSPGHVSLCSDRSYQLPGFAFLHDFALTKSYYIIFQNPVTVDNVPYILGKAPAASCVRWVSDTSTVLHLIPRDPSSSKKVQKFELPPAFVFHHANAYEEGNNVVIDSIHYKSLPAVGREALPEQGIDPNVAFNSKLKRVEIDTESGIVHTRSICDEYLEMPSVSPYSFGQKHRFVYGYKSDFDMRMIGVAQVDINSSQVSSWFPGPGQFLLEPRFIPRPNSLRDEDAADGWIIAQYFEADTARSEIVLFDAQRIEEGPICRMALRKPLPSALHGCWTDQFFGPRE